MQTLKILATQQGSRVANMLPRTHYACLPAGTPVGVDIAKNVLPSGMHAANTKHPITNSIASATPGSEGCQFGKEGAEDHTGWHQNFWNGQHTHLFPTPHRAITELGLT